MKATTYVSAITLKAIEFEDIVIMSELIDSLTDNALKALLGSTPDENGNYTFTMGDHRYDRIRLISKQCMALFKETYPKSRIGEKDENN